MMYCTKLVDCRAATHHYDCRSQETTLFSLDPAHPEDAFDGETYDPGLDFKRLGRAARAVWMLMRDGQWRTLAMVSDATGYPEASVSARLRDFRKARMGSHTVERRRAHGGLYEYRVVT
jgi:hypothetical protein